METVIAASIPLFAGEQMGDDQEFAFAWSLYSLYRLYSQVR